MIQTCRRSLGRELEVPIGALPPLIISILRAVPYSKNSSRFLFASAPGNGDNRNDLERRS